MFEMSTFHQWLSAKAKPGDVRRERLARLTRLDRAQVMQATGQLDWFIWSADETASA